MENDVTTNTTEEVAVEDVVVSEEAPVKKKQKKPINQQKLQDNIWGWTFCIPLIVGTVLFVYFALILAILLSFTDFKYGGKRTMWDAIGNFGKFVMQSEEGVAGSGPFKYYYEIFTKQESYGNPLIKYNEAGIYLFNTVFYMIGIPIGMVLAVFFAVCMSRDIKGGNVFRVLYYVPCVASSIAIIYTFKVLFANEGVMNQLFNCAADPTTQAKGFTWIPLAPSRGESWITLLELDAETNADSAFLSDPLWCQGLFTKLVIIIMSVWKGLGGTIILYIAGLSGVNAATKEAAQIDGANGWQIFWKVTMPDLYPVIFYNIVTSVIGGLQIYAEPELLGASGMAASGYVALVFRYGIQDTEEYTIGRGSAYGIALGIIIFIVTLFQFYLDRKNAE